MAFTPPPANWQTWKNVGDCPLWQAVILTLGYEPRQFAFHPQADDRDLIVAAMHLNFMPENAVYQTGLELVEAIYDRLMIAKSNAGKKFKIGSYYRRLAEASIELPEFGAWAVGVWPDLPSEFPKGDAPSVVPADATEKPMDRKQQDSHLLVIAALAKLADVPIDTASAAAVTIAKAAKELGTPINEGTVTTILKAVPDAMKRRKR